MVSIRNNSIAHLLNVAFILVVGYISLYFMLLYKAKVIAAKVVPLVEGKPAYDDESIKNWLNSFDRLIYLIMAVIILVVLVRYLIEVLVVVHNNTVFRTILFWIIGAGINFILLIYFFKSKAPVMEGDSEYILFYSFVTIVILYLQFILFVPGSIKYILFPRNIILRRK